MTIQANNISLHFMMDFNTKSTTSANDSSENKDIQLNRISYSSDTPNREQICEVTHSYKIKCVNQWNPYMLSSTDLKRLREKSKSLEILPKSSEIGIYFNRNRPSWAVTYWEGKTRKYRHFFIPDLSQETIQIVLDSAIKLRDIIDSTKENGSKLPLPAFGGYGALDFEKKSNNSLHQASPPSEASTAIDHINYEITPVTGLYEINAFNKINPNEFDASTSEDSFSNKPQEWPSHFSQVHSFDHNRYSNNVSDSFSYYNSYGSESAYVNTPVPHSLQLYATHPAIHQGNVYMNFNSYQLSDIEPLKYESLVPFPDRTTPLSEPSGYNTPAYSEQKQLHYSYDNSDSSINLLLGQNSSQTLTSPIPSLWQKAEQPASHVSLFVYPMYRNSDPQHYEYKCEENNSINHQNDFNFDYHYQNTSQTSGLRPESNYIENEPSKRIYKKKKFSDPTNNSTDKSDTVKHINKRVKLSKSNYAIDRESELSHFPAHYQNPFYSTDCSAQ